MLALAIPFLFFHEKYQPELAVDLRLDLGRHPTLRLAVLLVVIAAVVSRGAD